jgi:hypothetical protein
MTDIFISYAREDEGRVKELVSALEQQGWSAIMGSGLGCGMAMSRTLAGGIPARVTASHRPGIEPCR